MDNQTKNFLREHIFGDKIFKSVQAKYRRKFDFNKIRQKSQIYRWVKF